MGNVDIYSVGVKGVNQIVSSGRTECLAGRPYLRDSQGIAVSICTNSSYSSHV